MKNIFNRSRICLAILLVTAVLFFPDIVSAGTTPFALAPPSTSAGQIGGGNEVAPRGFSIDVNGPDEEGGMYWLQSEYDNFNWNPVYTGETNGYDEPIPATDKDGSTITYDFYAWVDRNPKVMTDPASSEPFIALYRDGERVEPFPAKLDAPSREDDIRDPSGSEMSDELWTKRWKVHFTLELEPGHDYSLAFLQGIVANNNVSAMVNEDETGYINFKEPLTSKEQAWYDAHKFDEYRYREYRYSKFKLSDTPQSKEIDTSVENPYEGLYRTMRFSFTTKLNESLYQLIAKVESLHSRAEVGSSAGQYPQEALDALGDAVQQAKKVPDDAAESEREKAASELKKAIDDFESQCIVEVRSVKIIRSGTEFHVGQTGTAEADADVTPDKAAYRKVLWKSSDNITINEKTGKWQIDYGGPCSITAVSTYDDQISDTWNFQVPMADGEVAVNVSSQTSDSDEKSALQKLVEKACGENTGNITSLKVSASKGVSLTDADILYIKSAFPDLQELDLSESGADNVPDSSFKDMESLKTVKLPETISSIGAEAFSGCSALSSAELPSSLTYIDRDAFKGCRSLGYDLYCYSPEAPDTGQSVTELFGDTGIKTVHVPYGCSQGYTKWSDSYDIVAEDEKQISVTVSSPGSLARYAEQKLAGTSDRDFDTLVVTGGTKLNDTDMEYIKSHFLRATTIDLSRTALDKCRAQSFIGRTALKKIVLPETVGTIGEKAFYGCSSLEEFVLPEGLCKIGNLAFGGCVRLPGRIVVGSAEPPELSDTAFDRDTVKGFIVPGQSVEKYKESYVWKDFDIISQVEITLDRSSVVLEEGRKTTVSADVLLRYGTDRSVSWKSSDTDIVQIDSEGRIFGRKAGRADITATAVQGGVQAVCHVTVKKSAAPAVSVRSSNYNQIRVSWSGISDADKYEVFRSEEKDGGYVKLATVTSSTTSYYDNGLTTGARYYYKVRACRTVDGIPYNSEYSSPSPASPVPDTPALKADKYSYSSCRLSWNKVSGASGYQIYRASSQKGTYKCIKSAGSGTKSYVNTGLSTGTTYYYKVRAWRNAGSRKVYGDFSPVRSARPELNKPGSLSVSKSSSYQYVKVKAKKGKTYYYKVRAYRKSGSRTVYSPYSVVKAYRMR